MGDEAGQIAEGIFRLLEKKGKVGLLGRVISHLQERGSRSAGLVKVFSALPLTASQKVMVTKTVRAALVPNEVVFAVDEGIIGGLKIYLGDEVIDLSLNQKLENL